jgi:hypothetical protein
MATDVNASSAAANVADRFAHIEALAARGLLEFAVIDPGSVNFTQVATSSAAKPAGTHLNFEADVRHVLDFAKRKGFHPAFAIYEPGFTRAGAALARATGVKTPIYRFMFSETFALGFSPKPLRAGCPSGAAGGRGGIGAVDDRRNLRRYPSPDR